MSTPRPAPNPQRRQRLLEAAERQFSHLGFRAVTMAGIAQEAGLAKATVYAYFADKEEIFRAVADAFATRVEAAVSNGLDGPGSLAERMVTALAAKDALVFRLVAGSPHAAELFDARDRLVRARFDELDARVLGHVTRALDDGHDRGLAPPDLARLLVRASRGLAYRASATEALVADIARLVPRLLGPSA